MTEPSEAAKAKASELWQRGSDAGWTPGDTVARFIQQVSDAAKPREDDSLLRLHNRVKHFILPEPVDPLRAALREIPDEDIRMISSTYDVLACRERIAEAMTKNGLKIVEASHD